MKSLTFGTEMFDQSSFQRPFFWAILGTKLIIYSNESRRQIGR